MPLSTIFQLLVYRGGQFYWRMGFELTTLVVISTDCIGSCKSNYHTIPTTVAPTIYVHVYCHKVFSLCCTSFRYGLKNEPLFVAYAEITIRSFLQS